MTTNCCLGTGSVPFLPVQCASRCFYKGADISPLPADTMHVQTRLNLSRRHIQLSSKIKILIGKHFFLYKPGCSLLGIHAYVSLIFSRLQRVDSRCGGISTQVTDNVQWLVCHTLKSLKTISRTRSKCEGFRASQSLFSDSTQKCESFHQSAPPLLSLRRQALPLWHKT